MNEIWWVRQDLNLEPTERLTSRRWLIRLAAYCVVVVDFVGYFRGSVLILFSDGPTAPL